MNEELTANEINKLITWLKNKGFSSDEVIECLQFITNNPNVTLNK